MPSAEWPLGADLLTSRYLHHHDRFVDVESDGLQVGVDQRVSVSGPQHPRRHHLLGIAALGRDQCGLRDGTALVAATLQRWPLSLLLGRSSLASVLVEVVGVQLAVFPKRPSSSRRRSQSALPLPRKTSCCSKRWALNADSHFGAALQNASSGVTRLRIALISSESSVQKRRHASRARARHRPRRPWRNFSTTWRELRADLCAGQSQQLAGVAPQHVVAERPRLDAPVVGKARGRDQWQVGYGRSLALPCVLDGCVSHEARSGKSSFFFSSRPTTVRARSRS